MRSEPREPTVPSLSQKLLLTSADHFIGVLQRVVNGLGFVPVTVVRQGDGNMVGEGDDAPTLDPERADIPPRCEDEVAECPPVTDDRHGSTLRGKDEAVVAVGRS